MKTCPECQKKVSDGVDLCDCGHNFPPLVLAVLTEVVIKGIDISLWNAVKITFAFLIASLFLGLIGLLVWGVLWLLSRLLV